MPGIKYKSNVNTSDEAFSYVEKLATSLDKNAESDGYGIYIGSITAPTKMLFTLRVDGILLYHSARDKEILGAYWK